MTITHPNCPSSPTNETVPVFMARTSASETTKSSPAWVAPSFASGLTGSAQVAGRLMCGPPVKCTGVLAPGSDSEPGPYSGVSAACPGSGTIPSAATGERTDSTTKVTVTAITSMRPMDVRRCRPSVDPRSGECLVPTERLACLTSILPAIPCPGTGTAPRRNTPDDTCSVRAARRPSTHTCTTSRNSRFAGSAG